MTQPPDPQAPKRRPRIGYARYALLTVPARRTAQLWRLALGVLLVFAIMFGMTQGIMTMLGTVLPAETFDRMTRALAIGDTPAGLLGMLVSMGAMGLAAFTVVEIVHDRRPASLVGPWPLARRQFWDVLFALVALNAVLMILPPWGLFEGTVPGLSLGHWLALLPLTLIALFIQTGSEELLFRGYLQSQLAARFKHPAVWLIVPSLVFGLGHYAPEIYGGNAWLVVIWAVIYGIASADLTARAGTLGPAVAMHLVNNFLAMGLVSMQGDMSGLALRLLPFGPEAQGEVLSLLPIDLASILVSWLAARIAIRA
ncbi:CPBP family intramembrane glutamic endopeptidase [Tropicibacter naphthalenivorans]|uniref:CAAX amino terminal protease self-immunity n=1 Tax=Tropicibacter naphthalenivorans TaxID=441103 RepID=A0A0P1GTT9_9RHOB|nr:CPBP family intramembrane glutamic endopeptidase [Tropicibacter naphthalenivorans]CUH79044.1 CAAX amino terminal protease self-immunity [Tropicibacter naphthalenivorans]SMD03777.1 hypothetical protein SAMN04488093_11180 [Tropicibacter naphthalenivorans]